MSLGRQAAQGAVWTAAAQFGGHLVMLAANVVLARLLMPADFGTASLALVIAVVVTAVNQFGLIAALIQRRELARRHYVTAFTTSIVSGVAFGLALLGGAGLVAGLFRNPGLVPVLRLYSLLFPLGGIAAVQTALLTRHLRFRPLAKAALAARLCGGAASVVLALAGCGVMSIAWGYVVLNLVNALALLPVSARVVKPGFGFSLPAFRELFGYGAGIMGMNLLNQLSANADVMLVGRFLGTVSLGFYSVAIQLASYLPGRLSAVLATVTFPAFARVQDDVARLRAAYLRLVGFTALVIAPLAVALAVTAPDVIRAVYGNRWSPAIVLLQILAAYGLVNGLSWPWQEVYKAQGRSARLLVMTAGQVAALVLAVIVGSQFGLTGVAVALAGFSFILQLAYQTMVVRGMGLAVADQAKALARPLACALISGGVMLAARAALAGLTPLSRLLFVIPVGAIVYAGAVALIDRATMGELIRLLGLPTAYGRAPIANRPTVCIMTSVHPANDARLYHKQALSLSRAGYDIFLAAPAHLPKHGVDESMVKLVPVRFPRNRLARMAIGALRMLVAALRTRANVCHLHDPELLPVGFALKTLGKRVIYDVHEDYPEQVMSKHYLPRVLKRTVAVLVGFVEKTIASRLDGVVCATDSIAAEFPCGRVVTVRNYPMVEVRSPESRVQTPDSKFRLVHLAGTLSEERGTTSMVRAMELLDNRFELVLAGRFVTPGYEAEVRSMAGFERVRHTDTVPHEQVWSVYQECDAGVVCLLPLERYKVSLPVKMFEFMAAGLPLVASDFPLFRHLVEGNGCGICVDPESPEQIAAAARRLARDPGLVQQMGAMGRKAAREKYSWQAEQQTLLALYREIASVQLRAGTATVFRGRKAVAVPAPNPEAVGV